MKIELDLNENEMELVFSALRDAREEEFRREPELMALPDGNKKQEAIDKMNERIRFYGRILKKFSF